MKILLAYISGATDRRDPYLNLLPTGLCSLHACLREAGYDAVLANYSGWSDNLISEHLIKLQPDIIGISQWTHNRHASMTLARQARMEIPFCTIMMGGGHATFSYLENLSEGSPVNCVVMGEGEDTLLNLVRHVAEGTSWYREKGIAYRYNGDVIFTQPRPPLANLDRLPYTISYLEHSVGVDFQLQPQFVLTARGCPSACHFCSSPNFWGRKVRFRSPENIVDEILYIRNRFGLIYFSLRDDTFTVDRSRTIEFCRLLIERRTNILWNCQSRVTTLDEEMLVWMKRAGCECIQLGVESGSPRTLSILGKTITARQVEVAAEKIGKVGIGLSVFLISDIPGETREDVDQTIELIKRICPDDGYVSPLAYYPGTRLFEDSVLEGRVSKSVFLDSQDAAVFASGNLGSKSRWLLKQLGMAHKPGSEQRFQQQRNLLGYCFATNVLAGEWYRQSGNYTAAEREFSEITKHDADNPWGWYLLAELYGELGRQNESYKCYRAVCRIVPEHKQSKETARNQQKKAGPEGPADCSNTSSISQS